MSRTLKFQAKILRFLCRPENKRYVGLVDDGCFDTPEMKLSYEVLRAYVKEFNSTPDAESAVEYLHQEAASRRMKPEVQAEYASYLEQMFAPRNEDTGLVIKSIMDYAATKRTIELFKRDVDKINLNGLSAVKHFHGELAKIAHLDQQVLELENSRGGFLIKDHTKKIRKIKVGHPTFLKRINHMTAAAGFRSPELVIILSAPKGFKTGLCIKIAAEYVRSGLRVYYVDAENGVDSIQDRFEQAYMECTLAELSEPDNQKVLTQVLRRVGKLGGDVNTNHYPAYGFSVADVESHLAELYAENGWRPDVIVWDYPDVMKAIVPQKEKRDNISRVYFDIINLNNRLGCFSIGVSQVNRAAVSKDVLTITDFAEDFQKAMNCHAAFALCRTETEVELGLGRIVPVAQRAGVRYKASNVCFVKIEEERMSIKELDTTDAVAQLTAFADRKKRPSRVRTKEELKDE